MDEPSSQALVVPSSNKVLTVAMPTRDALVDGARRVTLAAEALDIDSPEMYEMAGNELREVKAQIKAYDDKRKSLVGPLATVTKDINELFACAIDPRKAAALMIDQRMTAYRQKEEQERRRLQAEIDRLAREDAKRMLQEAEALAKAGKTEEAAIVADMAATHTPVTVAKTVPKVAGVYARKQVRGMVHDGRALLGWLTDNAGAEWWASVVDFKQSGLNALAAHAKGRNIAIPGLDVIDDEKTIGRSA